MRLVRVLLEIVELGPRRQNEPVPLVGRGRERTPAVGARGQQGLTVDRRRRLRPTREQPGKPRAERTRSGSEPEEGEQGSGQRARGHPPGDGASGGNARPGNHEGHSEGRPVDEDAVLLLSMLAEHLAVVPDGRDDAPAERRRKPREEPADLAVHVRHLAGVALLPGGALPVSRRLVRRVRIVVVDPEKVRAVARRRGRPRQGRVGDGTRAALRVPLLPHPLGDHRIVVNGEAAVQAEPAVEDPRRHESGGAVAAARQDRGERRDVGRERRDAVVADAVLGRIQPGHEAAVRRQGQRSGRQRVREARPALRERIEVRRQGPASDGPADVVRAGRVEGEQDEGRRRVGGVRDGWKQDEDGQQAGATQHRRKDSRKRGQTSCRGQTPKRNGRRLRGARDFRSRLPYGRYGMLKPFTRKTAIWPLVMLAFGQKFPPPQPAVTPSL